MSLRLISASSLIPLMILMSTSVQAAGNTVTASATMKSKYVSKIETSNSACSVLSSGGDVQAAGLGSALLGIILKASFSIIFESLDSSLEKKLKKYQYAESFRLEIEDIEAVKCIQIYRGIETKNAKPEILTNIYFDVALNQSNPNFTSFQLRPYKIDVKSGYENALGKTLGAKGDKLAFSTSVSATTPGPFGFVNMSSNKSEVIVAESFSISSKEFQYPQLELTRFNPNKPVFRALKIRDLTPPVSMSFTYSEVGTDKGKGQIKLWRKLLSKSSDDLNTTFTEAIIKLIESEDQDDGS